MSSFGTKRAKTDHSTTHAETRSGAYTIDVANRFVSVRFAETLTFHNIEVYVSELRADPQFDPDFSEIVDLREVERVEMSAKQAMNLADQIDPFSDSSKRAFVARSKAQSNAAHVHRILRHEQDNIRVFFSMEEAQHWVGK